MSEGKAHFYCGIVAVIWGLGFIAVDQALLSFSCFDILLIRFLGSSILAWLLIIKDIKKIHMKKVSLMELSYLLLMHYRLMHKH